MRLPNHIAGGFCLTGFIASVFFSINVLASPAAIAAVLAGSILPDADNPKSLAGRLLYPIAHWLNRRFGHRTLTHSIVFISSLALLCSLLEQTFSGNIRLTIVLVVAWSVHVLLDTFTLQGVQMMFPFSFEPYWMFARPDARIRNGDFKAEALFFLAFVSLAFAQRSLWENGFWTQFNHRFGDIAHLEAEFRRSPDALDVSASVKVGTQPLTLRGLLVRVEPSYFVLLRPDGFVSVGDDEVFLRASFRHTGRPLDIRSLQLFAVSPDSLNAALWNKMVLSLEVAANAPFIVTGADGIPKNASSFRADLLGYPPCFSSNSLIPNRDTLISDLSYLAEIELLQSEIRRIRQTDLDTRRQADDLLNYIANLRRQYAATADIPERQRLHDLIDAARKDWKSPPDPQPRIAALNDRIAKILHEASLRENTKRLQLEAKNQDALLGIHQTLLTASASWVDVPTLPTINPEAQ